MKIYIENGETTPNIKILEDADPAPPGYTESTTIANFFLYGVKYGLTEQKTLLEIINLITDWATHDAGEKQQVLDLIELNHFIAAITTAIRDDVTPPYLGFEIINTTVSNTKQYWNGSSWV